MCGCHLRNLVTRNRLLTCQSGDVAFKKLRNMSTRFYLGRDGAEMDSESFLGKIAEHVSKRDGKKKLVMFGENHQDPSAQKLELDILEKISSMSPVVLSLEFYDREQQTLLDEYLAGFVDGDAFARDSGGPQSCQGLVDFCKTSRIPVVAANCPRRYSKLV